VKADAFRLRGLKGLWWEPEQYRGWPAFLADAGYDFFMLCYTFCPETGLRWRQPIRDAEAAIISRLARECAERGITLCLALHPLIAGQAWAPEDAAVRFHPSTGRGWFVSYWQPRRPGEALNPDPPIRYGSAADLAVLAAKVRQAAALGVGTIALCLDDVDPGAAPGTFRSLAAAHLWLVEGIRAALGPGQRLQVVPTYYWTAGAQAHADYTAELARGLPPDVALYWTGAEVRDHAITAEKARDAARLYGRPPIVWLNYASNDSFRFAMQLPPGLPPAADLAPETAGLLLNSTRQTGLARLDALVIGAYLEDPRGYDHARAVHAAVVALAGAQAAPPLERLLDAWRAVPDVRSLAHDLQAGGRAFLTGLLERLGPLLATVDAVMPQLDALLTDRDLWRELAAGVERVRLLAEALAVLDAELTAAGASGLAPVRAASSNPADTAGRERSPFLAGTAGREALLARLAQADAEAACDAAAVLALVPAASA
jgi:hypothetical protein